MTYTPAHRVRRHRAALEEALLAAPHDAAQTLALSRTLDRLINHALRVRRGRFGRLPLRAARPRRQLRDSLMTPLR